MPVSSVRCSTLPEKVIPIAGMCVGWPAEEGGITPRLPLELTVHEDRFDEGDLAAQIDGYDRRRAASRPYRNQREPERFGVAPNSTAGRRTKRGNTRAPLRADFGAFVRAKGFHLD